MSEKKQATKALIRDLPPEWPEFRVICMREGVSANKKLKEFIIETVKKSKDKK